MPTYNEGSNVERVWAALLRACPDLTVELIFADDSTDDTRARLERMAKADPRVRLTCASRRRGLARAVADAMAEARGVFIAVLDADLQHPPELLPALVAAAEETGADLVVPSRYVAGGAAPGLSPWRRLVSRVAREMARTLLREARQTTDPLSGFFLLRRSAVQQVEWKPKGWKILLEVLVRGQVGKVVDVPYRFQPRAFGKSKLTWQVQVEYLRHLLELVSASPDSRRFWLFALVGASGVLVNEGLFDLLVRLGGHGRLWITVASLVATHVAMLSNFVWNYRFTWSDQHHRSLAAHLLRYVVVSEVGAGITALMASALAAPLRSPLVAELVGVVTAVVVTYQLADQWVFGRGTVVRRVRSGT